jgi:hypothetical protein
MKTIKTQLLLFSLLASLTSMAQVAGYLGKRFSVGYSNYFSPRFPEAGRMPVFKQDGKLSARQVLNSTHCLDMDYILGSRVSLCLSGQFSKMDLVKHGRIFRPANNLYLPLGSMELNTTNFSLGFKFFKKHYLNPLGRYRKVELILMRNKVVMKESSSYSLVDEGFKFSSFAFAYTMGKQRVFFDKLILDCGIRIGINYSYVYSNINPLEIMLDFETRSSEENIMQSKLREQANARTWGAQFVNAHIGLRFLAF